MEEDYFANINFSKNIEPIVPTSELLINFRINGLRVAKSCFVYAEKIDFKGLIQLRLTEKCDQRRMYITTVDGASFHELKQEQSLHVTFTGFIDNLVRILQDCQAGKLEIMLVQQPQTVGRPSDSLSGQSGLYQLQFLEMRPFKNLIHLCLPCRVAPLDVVLFYMNSILDAIQKKSSSQEHSIEQLQHEIHTHTRRIEQLDAENVKLRENLVENSRTLNQRHSDEMQQMQDSLRKAAEQRQQDNERHRKTISTLQTQLDKLGVERSSVQAEKIQEHKRNEMLNEELASAKSRISNLREQNEKLQNEIAVLKNTERKHDMLLAESRAAVTELQEKLKKYDKTKADIVAELEAEKKISHTKRQALEMATEEISKANEIILKQSQELVKLKKTIGWRTEVALQQEKDIKQKEQLLKMRDEQITYMQQTIDSLRQEIPHELDSLRKFANSLEIKYTEQINSLKKKLNSGNKENNDPTVETLRTNRRK